MTRRASEEDTLRAWADLLNAIQMVECAIPSQISFSIAELSKQWRLFDALMLGRAGRTGSTPIREENQP